MSDFEKMEQDYQKEHGVSEPYSKQAYAQKMHERDLEEMSQAVPGAWKKNIVGHQFDFPTYCREYQEKVDAHYRAKGEISPTEAARLMKESQRGETA